MLLFMHSIKCERRAFEASGIVVLFLFHHFLPLVSPSLDASMLLFTAVFSAQADDTVLIASNGNEPWRCA